MANIECTMYRLPNHAASKEDGPVRATAPRATGDPGLQVTLQDLCWWLSHSLLLTSRGCNSDLTLVEGPPLPPPPPPSLLYHRVPRLRLANRSPNPLTPDLAVLYYAYCVRQYDRKALILHVPHRIDQ